MLVSNMVVCDASATVGYDRRREGISNAPLNTDLDNYDMEI